MKDNWIPLEELTEGIRDVLGDDVFYNKIKAAFGDLKIYEINVNNYYDKTEMIRFTKNYLVSITNSSFKYMPYSMLESITKGSELLNETLFGKKAN